MPMNPIHAQIHRLLRLYDRDTDALQQLIRDYPASALPRVVLLKKYLDSGHADYEQLKTETAHYVSNIPWYMHLLATAQMNDDGNTEAENEQRSTTIEEDRTALTQVEDDALIISSDDAQTGLFHHEAQEQSGGADASLVHETENEQRATSGGTDTEYIAEEADDAGEGLHQTSPSDALPETVEDRDAAFAEEQAGQKPADNAGPTPEEHLDHTSVQNASGTPPRAVESEPAVEPVTAEQQETHEDAQAAAPPGKEDVAVETGSSLPFEPLHTIDYFASQGIRLSEEDLKDDKLSQQVRSFTGWLKSMKKLHPNKLPEQDAVVEQIIQQAAEGSNTATNVLTEAMAEVLVKQNKKQKAIEMYEKLSLMNPAKSAYFASKIENLKTT